MAAECLDASQDWNGTGIAGQWGCFMTRMEVSSAKSGLTHHWDQQFCRTSFSSPSPNYVKRDGHTREVKRGGEGSNMRRSAMARSPALHSNYPWFNALYCQLKDLRDFFNRVTRDSEELLLIRLEDSGLD